MVRFVVWFLSLLHPVLESRQSGKRVGCEVVASLLHPVLESRQSRGGMLVFSAWSLLHPVLESRQSSDGMNVTITCSLLHPVLESRQSLFRSHARLSKSLLHPVLESRQSGKPAAKVVGSSGGPTKRSKTHNRHSATTLAAGFQIYPIPTICIRHASNELSLPF